MSSKTDSRTQWTLLIAATVAVAGVLRLPGLDTGLWYDEIVTLVESARHPLRQIVTEFPGVNAHPLYSVLAHLSLVAFGESAWALRLPAVVFGIASVAMTYVLAARMTTRLEAWAAAAVLATSYHHIWFSQNARGYTLIGFLTLVATYFLLRASAGGRARDYLIYALACSAGIYAHLTMAFVVLGHAAVVLIGRSIGWRPAAHLPVRPALAAWIGVGVVSAIAYAPFVPGLLATLNAEEPRDAAQVATTGWAIAESIRSVLLGTGVPAAILGGSLAALGGAVLLRHRRLEVALLLVPAVVTGLAIVALGQPLRPRFFFFLSAAAAIFVGRGVGVAGETLARWLAPRRRGAPGAAVVACAALLMALSAVALPRNYRVPKQDYDGAVRFLEQAEAGGARVTASWPGCLPFTIYYRKEWRCLEAVEDWRAAVAESGRVLVASTLSDYIRDPALAARLRADCQVTRRFPGTLGGGDIIVCEVVRP